MKNKIKIIILIVGSVLISFAIFAYFVLFMFNAIQNDPLDAIAVPYLYEESGFADQYGEIEHVNRRAFDRPIETEDTISAPYSVETDSEKYLVYVTLERQDGQLVPTSWRVEKKLHYDD